MWARPPGQPRCESRRRRRGGVAGRRERWRRL